MVNERSKRRGTSPVTLDVQSKHSATPLHTPRAAATRTRAPRALPASAARFCRRRAEGESPPSVLHRSHSARGLRGASTLQPAPGFLWRLRPRGVSPAPRGRAARLPTRPSADTGAASPCRPLSRTRLQVRGPDARSAHASEPRGPGPWSGRRPAVAAALGSPRGGEASPAARLRGPPAAPRRAWTVLPLGEPCTRRFALATSAVRV